MKKLLLIFLALGSLISLTACPSGEESAAPAESPAAEGGGGGGH